MRGSITGVQNLLRDETSRNFYASYNCDFKVYMKDKPGNYGLSFHVLADAQDLTSPHL